MKVNDYDVPDDLYYSREHEWLRIQRDRCRIGITDYAQKSLHEVVFVELPEVGRKVSQMEPMATMESVKSVSEVYSPVSGQVVQRNERLVKEPELVNKEPYGEGWIVVIQPTNLESDLKTLMKSDGYGSFIRELSSEKG